MKNIILFGEIGAGKDTVAEILEEEGYKIGKLGKEIRRVVGEKSSLMDIPKEKQRTLLVAYGQGMREIFGENLWCKELVKNELDKIQKGELCIADARQVNEYFFFKRKYDFMPIGITAKATVREGRVVERDGVSQMGNFNDVTERQARKVLDLIKRDPFGYIIENNGTIEELTEKILAIKYELNRQIDFS